MEKMEGSMMLNTTMKEVEGTADKCSFTQQWYHKDWNWERRSFRCSLKAAPQP